MVACYIIRSKHTVWYTAGMAKKHKQHLKRARKTRERRTPDKSATPQAVNASPAAPIEKPATPTPAQLAPPRQPVGVKASFTASPARQSSGTADTAAEFPYIRRDLRKLGLTIVFFAAILGGLTVLSSQTTALDDLGSYLFTWWR
jgi:hypothetical protein